MTRLRRLLPDGAIASTPAGYRLDAEVDAHRFRRLVAEGRPAEAMGLWRGDALADLPDCTGARAALEEQRMAAIEDRAEAELARGGAVAVAELSELAAANPYRERLHALLFRALRAAGRGAEALARYEDLRRRLADELGADPGPELRAVHLELLEPAPPPARRPRGNLRAALTSFVGRETETAELRRSLESSRLVTVTGPGGVGKTRLASSVAADLGDALGGVWMVELASVTDPDDVAQAVAQTLGVFEPEPPKMGPRSAGMRKGHGGTVDRLAEALTERSTLLLLDNCEHVIGAAADLADRLLGACPGLRIAATSREPLAITGETVHSSAPPGRGRRQTVRRPCGRVPAGPRPRSGRRRRDLPEARRTAAGHRTGRRQTAGPVLEQLAERLDDRFRLLTGGSRTALPRHQTLRAVVAWSWDLLEADERELAEAAAVFGGLTIEAAEWLGGSLETVTALADKSILRPTGTGAFRMLETLREYGRERLEATGRLDKARAAHAAYCLDLAERAEPHVRGADQLEWRARLDAEHDDILAALHYAAASGDADTALRIAAAMSMHWFTGGPWPDVAGWYETALRAEGEASEPARVAAEGMLLVNRMMCGTFQPDDVLERFRAIVAAADPYADHPLLALAEPMLLMFTDEHERGEAVIEARMDHPDAWVRAVLRMLRALLMEDRGEITDMRVELRRAVEAFRDVGDRLGLEHSLMWLAQADLMFGDFAAGIEGLRESIRLQRELSPDSVAAQGRAVLAQARAVSGDTEAARAELESIIADTGEREGDFTAPGNCCGPTSGSATWPAPRAASTRPPSTTRRPPGRRATAGSSHRSGRR
ncbi:BTAD domain-containing putative transcriptional regulator [Glycomyces albus]